MTWQRIDENTYIDDTLVTCAEYQLFIDEMREQGEYYQPDHWTSYQFPDGQARRPILGVRFSDAWGFCGWLANREDGEWRYRLPKSTEATKYLIRHITDQSSLGYWVVSPNNRPDFTWIVPAPVDARMLESALAIKRALELPLGLDPNHDLKGSIKSAINRSKIKACVGNPARFVEGSSTYAFKRAFECITKFAPALDSALTMVHIYARNGRLEQAIDFFIDIFTLEERIAGHSPAFEGIRLVKERRKTGDERNLSVEWDRILP